MRSVRIVVAAPLFDDDLGLFKNQLVRRQVRYRPMQMLVLLVQLFQRFELVATHTSVLLTSSVVRLLGGTHCANHVGSALTLPYQSIDLAPFGDNFLRIVSFRTRLRSCYLDD